MKKLIFLITSVLILFLAGCKKGSNNPTSPQNNDVIWTAADSGITNNTVNSLAVSGTNLFSGTNGGVFLSTNSGASWTAENSGLTNTGVAALAVSGTVLYAGTAGGGIFLSMNNGTSWIVDTIGLASTPPPNTSSSAFSAYDVYALTVSNSNILAGTGGGGVFISTNNGAKWTRSIQD